MPDPKEIQTNQLWIPHTRSLLLEHDKELVTSSMEVNTAAGLDVNGHTPSQEVIEKSGCWEAGVWRFGSQKGGRNWGDT